MKFILVTCMVMPELRAITMYNVPLGTAFKTLFALNYNSFILTLGIIIGVALYSIEVGAYKVSDSHARDMVKVIVKGHVYC